MLLAEIPLVRFVRLSGVTGLGLTIAFRGGQVYVKRLLRIRMEVLAKGIQSPAIFWGDK